MSQMPPPPPPPDTQWQPPPPPTIDSPFDPRVLADKTEFVNKNAVYALIFAVAGVLCCGLLNIYALSLANSVLETIEYYSIGQDKKPLALAAKVVAIVGIVLWILGIILRIVFR